MYIYFLERDLFYAIMKIIYTWIRTTDSWVMTTELQVFDLLMSGHKVKYRCFCSQINHQNANVSNLQF